MGKGEDTDMKVTRGRGEVVPKDFAAAVKDIKLAILQSRARAAPASNVEALKLYFYVGGYVPMKTRTAKWGSGAIDALSNRLQVELPGLRGFSVSNIKYMRIFFEAWTKWFEIRHLASDESPARRIRQMPSDENNDLARGAELDETALIPLGIATYKTLKSIPKPYRSLAPVIEGVRRELANGLKECTKKKACR